jgi:hypothetical protein
VATLIEVRLTAVGCHEARRLLTSYTSALEAFYELQLPLPNGMSPRDPAYPGALDGKERASCGHSSSTGYILKSMDAGSENSGRRAASEE